MAIVYADDNSFKEEVSGPTVLVDFYADWCGPCRRLSPILEELSNENDSIKIVKVDVDKAENISKEFGIMTIPTIMVFKDGKSVSSKVGLLSKDELLEMMDI